MCWPSPTVAHFATKRVFHGRSRGTSVRVMRGVSVQTGGSRGEAKDEFHMLGTGQMWLTTKHMYFTPDAVDGRAFPRAPGQAGAPARHQRPHRVHVRHRHREAGGLQLPWPDWSARVIRAVGAMAADADEWRSPEDMDEDEAGRILAADAAVA